MTQITRFGKPLSYLPLMGLGLGLAVIEILLHFALPGPPLKVYNIDMRGVNPISEISGLVYELKPGAKRVLRIGDHAATYRINSLGMRDYEYPLIKKDRVFRIVCLGDSVTFGAGVELNQLYSKVLETLLNARSVGSATKYSILECRVITRLRKRLY